MRGPVIANVLAPPKPSFSASLTNSLVPEIAVNGTPTYSRSTTATVVDQDGIIRYCLSGEARFSGARRVQNLLSATTTLSTQSVTVIAGTYVFSMGSCSGSVTFSGAATGTLAGDSVNRKAITLTTTAASLTITVSGSVLQGQLENVTGQTNQNPGEYVSVGVLSFPYHGCGADGVQYFPYLNGNTVSSGIVTAGVGAPIPASTLLGYLGESSRTNLITYSQNSTTNWNIINTTFTLNAATCPDGSNQAMLWTRSSTAAAYYLQQLPVKAASALVYTQSVYVKANVGNYCALRIQGAYPSRADVVFNLSNGTISTAAVVHSAFTSPSATITNVGGGWYRCTLTATSDTSNLINALVSFSSNGVVLDGTDSVSNSSGYIFGCQLEQASFATSYIPTTSTSITCNADSLSYAGSNHSATDMTISFTAIAQNTSAYCRLVNDNWANNNSWLLFTSLSNNQVLFGNVGGSTQFNSNSATNSISANVPFKVAGTFSTTKKVDGTKLAVNGALNANTPGASDSGAAYGTISQNNFYILDCGISSNSGGNIKNLVIRNKYLDSEKLRILTI